MGRLPLAEKPRWEGIRRRMKVDDECGLKRASTHNGRVSRLMPVGSPLRRGEQVCSARDLACQSMEVDPDLWQLVLQRGSQSLVPGDVEQVVRVIGSEGDFRTDSGRDGARLFERPSEEVPRGGLIAPR